MVSSILVPLFYLNYARDFFRYYYVVSIPDKSILVYEMIGTILYFHAADRRYKVEKLQSDITLCQLLHIFKTISPSYFISCSTNWVRVKYVGIGKVN